MQVLFCLKRKIFLLLQSDLDHNIFKKRFDEHGNPVEIEAKKEGKSNHCYAVNSQYNRPSRDIDI